MNNINNRGFILNIVIIIVILTVVFLSQQNYFQRLAGDFYSWVLEKFEFYRNQVSNWLKEKIYPAVSSEVEKRGGAVKQEVERQKDNIVKVFWGKFKNYFAEKFSGTFKTDLENGSEESPETR